MFLRNFFKGFVFFIPICLLGLAAYWFICISTDNLSAFPLLAWADFFILIVALIWHARWATKDEIQNKVDKDKRDAEKKAVIDAYYKHYGL